VKCAQAEDCKKVAAILEMPGCATCSEMIENEVIAELRLLSRK
jgi:hypothetical protein